MMEEHNKFQLNQEIFDIYDDYAHNRITRRDLMQKLSAYAVGGLTVASLMSFILPDYLNKIQLKADDPRIKTSYITYNSPKGGGQIKALLAMPADMKTPLGGVVVVHENRGLNPHIEDVGRRAALAGFISISPDALTPLGGYPGNDDEGRTLQSKRDRNEMLEDFLAAGEYLRNHKDCNGKVGVVGFCFGGWISNMMAVRDEKLAASVPFYGGQPASADVASIKAPLLLHFASLDTRVNEGWPAYEAELKAQNKTYTAYIYEGVNHGFHNDSTPRFDKSAAELAWKRTTDFFEKYLK